MRRASMLKACYSPRYYAKTHTNSMEKLSAVAEVLHQQQMVEFVDPGIIDVEILKSYTTLSLLTAL